MSRYEQERSQIIQHSFAHMDTGFLAVVWLILIPANYLIDRLVLRWSLGEMPDKGAFCRKLTWKIGFAAGGDHCAVSVLFSVKAVVLSDAPDEIIESRKGYLTSQT